MKKPRATYAAIAVLVILLWCGQATATTLFDQAYNSNTPELQPLSDTMVHSFCAAPAPECVAIAFDAQTTVPDRSLANLISPQSAPAVTINDWTRSEGDENLLAAFAEPSTLALVLIGLLGILFMRWRRALL